LRSVPVGAGFSGGDHTKRTLHFIGPILIMRPSIRRDLRPVSIGLSSPMLQVVAGMEAKPEALDS
jgi:hypothetical protein